jgi:hypothetical protein
MVGEVFLVAISAALSVAGGYAAYELVRFALGRARR